MEDLGFNLYVVPTPLGNMDDMTFRAIQVLGWVDIVLAEDTRTSGKLLKHFDIKAEMWSHHQHNEVQSIKGILQALDEGKTLALISDAGTPGISDPGHLLIKTLLSHGYKVTTLPGATALIPALVNSGFKTDRFTFEGFLPTKKGRIKKLTALKEEPRTIIIYESPHRIIKFLTQALDIFGSKRKIYIGRELSKFYEQSLISTIPEALAYFQNTPPKGEFVIVIEGESEC